MRGLAVVVMIWAHTLDAWTVTAEKTSYRYWYVMLDLGHGGADVPVPRRRLGLARLGLEAASRPHAARAAARPMVRRGFWIWALALLFRVQAFVLSPGATLYGILKVDILNVMGPGDRRSPPRCGA